MYSKERITVDNSGIMRHTWTPDGEPVLILQICHGMAEHLSRYDELAQYLCGRGIMVCGIDHPGHGESDGIRGHFGNKQGLQHLIGSNIRCAEDVKAAHPGVKYVIMGHSMGSFIARYIAGYHPDTADAYIFMGTAGHNGAVGAGKALASLISVLGGRDKPSPFIAGISTGAYAKNPGYKTEFDWLSTDEREVKKYIDDEQCGFCFTAAGYKTMFTMLQAIDPKGWAAKLDKHKPYFIPSGADDPVGDFGKGVMQVYDAMTAAGCDNVTYKLYQGGRHEILNDTVRDEVKSDIAEWLERI